MAYYSIKCTYDDVALTTDGLVARPDVGYLISPLSLSTFGFLWDYHDVWVDADNCYPSVWLDCACNTVCD